MTTTVFISYSHHDEAEKDRLLAHLGVLERMGLITVWPGGDLSEADEDSPQIANRSQPVSAETPVEQKRTFDFGALFHRLTGREGGKHPESKSTSRSALPVSEAIDQAQVAMLLISPDYLNSSFLMDQEVPALLERREQKELILFPVIIKDCLWQQVDWLRNMNVRPRSGQPVWREGGAYADQELVAIAGELERVIEWMSGGQR